ncbi:MAG: hypothetical protein A2007_04540 [Verrucomicrobia bacterium GWC2_42_7]|nr:MAG: hypothetical protein A2007_04540 [Verrucomicrobia bacterium GWC2_42_7]
MFFKNLLWRIFPPFSKGCGEALLGDYCFPAVFRGLLFFNIICSLIKNCFWGMMLVIIRVWGLV